MGTPTDLPRQVALVAVVGLVLSAVVVGGWFNRGFLLPDPAAWERGRLVTDTYDPPQSPVELFHDQGDGQAFAHEATDPLLRRPVGVQGGPQEQAYRLQRPLYGWAGWLAAAGDPDLVGWSLIWVTILAVGALAAVGAVAAARCEASPLWGVAFLAAPGVVADLIRCGPEAAATALVVAGLLAWCAPRPRTWLAVGCFAAAGLCRETMLLVPLALALAEAVPAGGAWLRTFRRSPLLLSAAPWALWVLLLRVRVGAWPVGSASGRLSVIPFQGLLRSLGGWSGDDALALLLIALPVAAALASSADRRLRAIVGAHVLLAATLGPAVWAEWLSFGRVLLPASAVALLALGEARRSAATGRRRPTMERCSDPRPAPSPMLPARTSSRTPTAG